MALSSETHSDPTPMSTFSAPVSEEGSEGDKPAPKTPRKRAPRKQASKKVTPKEG